MSAQQTANGGLSLEGVRAIYGIPKEAQDSAYRRTRFNTQKVAKPRRSSDIERVSKMRIKYRDYEGELLPSQECTCAISHDCPHKPGGEHDCRTLAPMPKPAHDSGWQPPGRLIDTKIHKDHKLFVQTVKYFGVLAHDLRSDSANFPQIHQYVRKWLSEMRCFSMNPAILSESKILEIISDFSRWIVKGLITYRRVPQDIRSDLVWLKRKWQKGDWDLSDPLRGINVADKGDSRSLNKDWEFYNPHWNRFGHNGLISGESWMYRIVIMRDGGHGSPEAGISGIMGQGATAVILSIPETRDEYADWDIGYKIGYVSTASPTKSPTGHTRFLLDSYEWYLTSKIKIEGEERRDKDKKDRPVRVFRSWKLPPKNKWRPRSGYRYDGLYDVVDKELIDEERALYRFTMERRPDQGKIRVDQPDEQTMLLWHQCAAVQKTARGGFDDLF